MSVDLADLIPNLKAEINVPGGDLYPTVTDDSWLIRLSNAYWEGRIYGLYAGYQEFDGIVNPVSGTTDFPREMQQLVILYAGFKVTLNAIQGFNTTFKAKAGSVEFETQKSATALKGILDTLKSNIDLALETLGGAGVTNTYSFDALIQGNYNMVIGEMWWAQ